MAEFTGKALDIIGFLMGDGIDKEVLWDISKHKEKRSLNSNGYYWQLLEKIAVKTHTSKAELHNINLRHLGLVELVGDKPVYILLPDTEKAERDTLLASTYHLAPRRETKMGTDGKNYRWYVMLRGSSDMNVQEMSALVDFAVQDAKALGIETLTPAQLEQMREIERQHEQKNKGNINPTESTTGS